MGAEQVLTGIKTLTVPSSLWFLSAPPDQRQVDTINLVTTSYITFQRIIRHHPIIRRYTGLTAFQQIPDAVQIQFKRSKTPLM
jgi:hypothetical protein